MLLLMDTRYSYIYILLFKYLYAICGQYLFSINGEANDAQILYWHLKKKHKIDVVISMQRLNLDVIRYVLGFLDVIIHYNKFCPPKYDILHFNSRINICSY